MNSSFSSSFSSLLDSVNFFSNFYQNTFYRFSKDKVDLNELFDERDLDAAIHFMPEGSDDLKLVFNGIGLPIEKLCENGVIDLKKLMRQHHGGATMIFNYLNHHSNRLFHFNRYLESVFNGHVHTNFYGTPTNSRGLKPHIDKHDVFVLQLKGSKNWSFYKHKLKTENRLGKAYATEELVLEEKAKMEVGDLLYVPRGLMHAATAVEEISWHLTIGVTGYYWSDHIKNIVDDLSSLSSAFQKVVPKDISPTDVKAELEKLCDEIGKQKSMTSGFKKFTQRFPNLGKDLGKITLPDSQQLAQLKESLLFQRTSSDLKITIERNELVFDLPYRKKPLRLHPRIKGVIDLINSDQPFSASNFSFLGNKEEKLLLAYYLWNNGVIEPLTD